MDNPNDSLPFDWPQVLARSEEIRRLASIENSDNPLDITSLSYLLGTLTAERCKELGYPSYNVHSIKGIKLHFLTAAKAMKAFWKENP